jgi:hypothetical protein
LGGSGTLGIGTDLTWDTGTAGSVANDGVGLDILFLMG